VKGKTTMEKDIMKHMKHWILATSVLLSIGDSGAMEAAEFRQLRENNARIRVRAAAAMRHEDIGLSERIYDKHIRGTSYNPEAWTHFSAAVVLDCMGLHPTGQSVGLDADTLSGHTIPEQIIILNELFEKRFEPFEAFLPIGRLCELRAYRQLISSGGEGGSVAFPWEAFNSVVEKLDALWFACGHSAR
jgi:hypothetical protein